MPPSHPRTLPGSRGAVLSGELGAGHDGGTATGPAAALLARAPVPRWDALSDAEAPW
jgi:hypothetical protein